KNGISCIKKNIVDLTWDFDNNTIYWTGIKPFVYTKMVGNSNERGYWYAMNEFCAGEHGGTHFDAPYHFNKDGWKVGEVPIDKLVAKGALIDLRNETQGRVENISLDNEHGAFDQGTVLLIQFGRSQNWHNRTKYLGLDENGKLNFPGISKQAAEWIAKSGKFYGVGLDTPSVDPGSTADFMTHRIFGQYQIYGLENVKLVETLPVRGFTLLVMPMKLREGTGAPLRLLAVLTSESIW
ncbi:hypothetical protein NQ317_006452, partial [Molorchus minor]